MFVRSSSEVKVKGLFCVISKASAASFCSYGLLGHSDASSLPVVIHRLEQQLFTTPWYLRSIPSINEDGSSNSSQHVKKSAKLQARQNPVISENVRFSRHSISKSLLRSGMASELDKSAGGVCLALCRVLLHRVCTVPGDISSEDMNVACERGYDAIYSQAK